MFCRIYFIQIPVKQLQLMLTTDISYLDTKFKLIGSLRTINSKHYDHSRLQLYGSEQLLIALRICCTANLSAGPLGQLLNEMHNLLPSWIQVGLEGEERERKLERQRGKMKGGVGRACYTRVGFGLSSVSLPTGIGPLACLARTRTVPFFFQLVNKLFPVDYYM